MLSTARLSALPGPALNAAVEQMSDAEACELLREALSQGNLRFTERLCRAFAARNSPSADLRQMMTSLAPTRVSTGGGPKIADDSEANQRWCAQHQKDYRGRWVALRQGQLLASSSSLKGLRHSLTEELRRSGPPLILHIPEC